jgi:hypothetical protein
LQFVIGDGNSSEEDEDVVCEVIDNKSITSQQSSETFLPNVGIVMSNIYFKHEDEVDPCQVQLTPTTPEIIVEQTERKVPKTLQVIILSYIAWEKNYFQECYEHN